MTNPQSRDPAAVLVAILKAALAPVWARILAVEARALEPGPQGKAGDVGPVGPAGPQGRDGRDGQTVVGPQGFDGKDGTNGINGKDGADGLGFDDASLVFDAVGRPMIRWARGEREKTQYLGTPVYLGVYQPDMTYEKGDMVTSAGSQWIALEKTTERPREGGTVWRLAVKRGADGHEGKPGPPGPQGPKGERGPYGIR